MRDCASIHQKIRARQKVHSRSGIISMRGHSKEVLVMRLLTSGFVVLILTVAPVTVASAQVLTCVQGICSSHPRPLPPLLPPLANLPSPDPNALLNQMPTPLPAPSQPPAINGPMPQLGLPLPVPAAPAMPTTPPSVFQSAPVPSVFQSQTGL